MIIFLPGPISGLSLPFEVNQASDNCLNFTPLPPVEMIRPLDNIKFRLTAPHRDHILDHGRRGNIVFRPGNHLPDLRAAFKKRKIGKVDR